MACPTSRDAIGLRVFAWALVLSFTLLPEDALRRVTAQEADRTATIRAVLRDSSDAVLPGVTVTLLLRKCRCEDCKDSKKCTCCPEQRSAISDEDGVVSLTVPGGKYLVRAEMSGFKAQEREVDVAAGGTRTVTLTIR
jgi:hypothetical protein